MNKGKEKYIQNIVIFLLTGYTLMTSYNRGWGLVKIELR